MFTRRNVLLLILVLLGLDFGFSRYSRPAAPEGWKVERWEAGFGSWAQGGFGVAYDIALPRDYGFSQKCGSAWIVGDDDSSEDFRIKLTFAPSPAVRDSEFAEFLRSDAAHMASELGRAAADLQIGAPTPFAIGALRFSRRDVTLPSARFEGENGATKTGTARGFSLGNENLVILADLQGEPAASVSERIVGSLRHARGVGLFDLLTGAIPGLLGC
jgi:hypothetical protein